MRPQTPSGQINGTPVAPVIKWDGSSRDLSQLRGRGQLEKPGPRPLRVLESFQRGDETEEREGPHHMIGHSSASHLSKDGNLPHERRIGPHYSSAEQCKVCHAAALVPLFFIGSIPGMPVTGPGSSNLRVLWEFLV